MNVLSFSPGECFAFSSVYHNYRHTSVTLTVRQTCWTCREHSQSDDV